MASPSSQIDSQWVRNFAFGIHSNIPICCVLYFCNVWGNFSDDDRRDVFNMREMNGREPQYVRCPECFKKDRRVKIHFCNDNCHFTEEFDRNWFPPVTRTRRKA